MIFLKGNERMNIVKFLGVSLLVLGLVACGDKSEEAPAPEATE